MRLNILLVTLLLWSASAKLVKAETGDTIAIPSYIVYVLPAEKGVRIDETRGITRWNSDQIEIQCNFHLAATGKLNLALLAAPTDDESTLSINLKGKNFVVKTQKNADEKALKVGSVKIGKPGYYCIKMKGISKKGSNFPSIRSFLISGEAAKGAHFNTKTAPQCCFGSPGLSYSRKYKSRMVL